MGDTYKSVAGGMVSACVYVCVPARPAPARLSTPTHAPCNSGARFARCQDPAGTTRPERRRSLEGVAPASTFEQAVTPGPVSGAPQQQQPPLQRHDSGASTLSTLSDSEIHRAPKPGTISFSNFEVRQPELDVWEFRRVRMLPAVVRAEGREGGGGRGLGAVSTHGSHTLVIPRYVKSAQRRRRAPGARRGTGSGPSCQRDLLSKTVAQWGRGGGTVERCALGAVVATCLHPQRTCCFHSRVWERAVVGRVAWWVWPGAGMGLYNADSPPPPPIRCAHQRSPPVCAPALVPRAVCARKSLQWPCSSPYAQADAAKAAAAPPSLSCSCSRAAPRPPPCWLPFSAYLKAAAAACGDPPPSRVCALGRTAAPCCCPVTRREAPSTRSWCCGAARSLTSAGR